MRLWKVVSFVTSVPSFACITFLLLLPLVASENALVSIALSICFLTVLPLAIVFYFVRKGEVDWELSSLEKRPKVFGLVTLCYLLNALSLHLINAPHLFRLLSLCYLLNGIVFTLISLRWKISVHTAGVAGPVTFLVYAYGIIASLLYLLTIPVAICRLKLEKHSIGQALAGICTAIALTIVAIAIG